MGRESLAGQSHLASLSQAVLHDLRALFVSISSLLIDLFLFSDISPLQPFLDSWDVLGSIDSLVSSFGSLSLPLHLTIWPNLPRYFCFLFTPLSALAPLSRVPHASESV